MEETLTPEEIEMYETTCALEEAADTQQAEQKKLEEDEKQSQLADEAQAAADKANQELSKIPQKIEDDLDEFNKTLKGLMGKNISPKVNVNDPDFDLDIAMGDFKKILDPLIGAVAPIEAVVGKVPIIGDVMGAITKLTSNNNNGGLTKEEIKALVPNKPEIPQSLLNKVDETCRTIQEFCMKLPTLLIDVIFQMLNAIFDMFNQIAGVIGVPSFPFPFNLITSMPPMMPKVKDFISSAPSQVKDIVMGSLKEKFAAAQALSIPKMPEPSAVASAAADKAKETATTASGMPTPAPADPSPVESPVVSTPPAQAIPPSAPKDLSMDEVKAKWVKRFSDDYNYDGEEVAKVIDKQLEVFNGSNEELTMVQTSVLHPVSSIKRKEYTAENVDKWLNNEYKFQKEIPKIIYNKLAKANEAVDLIPESFKTAIATVKNLGEKEVVVRTELKPKSSFLSWCGF